MSVKTRIFEIAEERGYVTDKALAEAMGITPFMLCRVKSGEQKITGTFIEGAQKAFPDKTLDELFYVDEPERAIA